MPRDYVAWAFNDQAAAECKFGVPIVAGDRAAVDWWAVVTSTDGFVETLAGTSLVRFSTDYLVIEQRDAWSAKPGRHELPDWAPRERLPPREPRYASFGRLGDTATGATVVAEPTRTSWSSLNARLEAPAGRAAHLFTELPLLLAQDRNLPARIPVAQISEGAGFAAAAPSQ